MAIGPDCLLFPRFSRPQAGKFYTKAALFPVFRTRYEGKAGRKKRGPGGRADKGYGLRNMSARYGLGAGI